MDDRVGEFFQKGTLYNRQSTQLPKLHQDRVIKQLGVFICADNVRVLLVYTHRIDLETDRNTLHRN